MKTRLSVLATRELQYAFGFISKSALSDALILAAKELSINGAIVPILQQLLDDAARTRGERSVNITAKAKTLAKKDAEYRAKIHRLNFLTFENSKIESIFVLQ